MRASVGRRPRPTIRDVASVAGVSKSTVSNVIRDAAACDGRRDLVEPKTDAARFAGYRTALARAGVAAATELVQRVEGRDDPGLRQLRLAPTLVVRRSTAPPQGVPS